ncbi:hypothetical protein EVAR_92996_1 [Eumeta japonica]|uniref:Uncharacterized protein n=1 Tax=Eumeta variegata TaxID=151549 RepID=A0A4C1TBK0_EUMVA|nr:hypothetical protein EVAR_92996_1 [Eumeta japonica]
MGSVVGVTATVCSMKRNMQYSMMWMRDAPARVCRDSGSRGVRAPYFYFKKISYFHITVPNTASCIRTDARRPDRRRRRVRAACGPLYVCKVSYLVSLLSLPCYSVIDVHGGAHAPCA